MDNGWTGDRRVKYIPNGKLKNNRTMDGQFMVIPLKRTPNRLLVWVIDGMLG